jgi:hypothetical protein
MTKTKRMTTGMMMLLLPGLLDPVFLRDQVLQRERPV